MAFPTCLVAIASAIPPRSSSKFSHHHEGTAHERSPKACSPKECSEVQQQVPPLLRRIGAREASKNAPFEPRTVTSLGLAPEPYLVSDSKFDSRNKDILSAMGRI